MTITHDASGWFASHWNAFLFQVLLLTLFKFQLALFEEYLDMFNATVDDGT